MSDWKVGDIVETVTPGTHVLHRIEKIHSEFPSIFLIVIWFDLTYYRVGETRIVSEWSLMRPANEMLVLALAANGEI